MPGDRKSLGVCLGASTVSIVQVGLKTSGQGAHRQTAAPPAILDYALYPHDGNPSQTLIRALEHLDFGQFTGMAAT